MSKSLFIIPLLFVAGCGKSQPPELTNAMVTVIGKPNASVYLTVNSVYHTVDGKESATTGSSDYGKRTLDKNGRYEKAFKSVHGLDVVLVALTDDPLKLIAKADNMTEQTADVSEQLKYANVKIGYQTEPGSMFAADPDASVSKARTHIADKTDKP